MTAATLDSNALESGTNRTCDEYGNEIIVEDGIEYVVMWPLSGAELAHYVCHQPDIVHARAVLVECYRRLTDYAYPASVVRQIETEINGLAAWCGWEVTP